MTFATPPPTVRKRCVTRRRCGRGAGGGVKNSSNSNRLAELAQRVGKPAYLIDSAADIQESWLSGARHIGVTAGASAPDVLVQEVISRLKALGGMDVHEISGREENIVFEVPKELRVDVRQID